MQPAFAIVAPNFHPTTCGIGDHSLRLGCALRQRGYVARIFTREPASAHPEAPDLPVQPIPGRTPLLIANGIARQLARDGTSHLILQYVPQLWGASRFGTPAAVWLATQARRSGIKVVVIAHELAIPVSPRPDLMLGAVIQRAQLLAVAASSDLMYVTTDTRAEQVAKLWRTVGRTRRPGVIRIGAGALPQPKVRRAGRLRLGVFTTLAVGKRFDVVLGAFERVWRARPESELVLLGDLGRREDRRTSELQADVDRHPARERIRITGRLPLADIAREMAELDVYLFPMSTGANSRSSTLPVALGSGLPVVAIRGTETDEQLFRDRENVLFAASLTAEAFARGALEILEAPALEQRLSEGARRLYEDHLSWDKVVDELLASVLALG